MARLGSVCNESKAEGKPETALARDERRAARGVRGVAAPARSS
jgi:hypothetical protein